QAISNGNKDHNRPRSSHNARIKPTSRTATTRSQGETNLRNHNANAARKIANVKTVTIYMARRSSPRNQYTGASNKGYTGGYPFAGLTHGASGFGTYRISV